ncbi:MAG: pantetheine-phosphate adenylyltransferase [Prevotella sp.]|nr:pantetheine-phosphate adenylyltransferase [Prevotella sp.]
MTNTQPKIGLFVGSFDPFTIGHADIVERALPLFDRLIIGVGDNPGKQTTLPANDRVAAIASLYADDSRIEVVAYSGLTIDLAHEKGARYIVRGIRSVKDFEYERDMVDLNSRLGHVETVLLYARPELASVSSSAVRELRALGKDVDWMLPKASRQAGEKS